MSFFLKEIVVCSCNIVFDFFLKMYHFDRQHYVGLYCYLNVLICFIIKINRHRSMLWSLWIIYILFADNSKQK